MKSYVVSAGSCQNINLQRVSNILRDWLVQHLEAGNSLTKQKLIDLRNLSEGSHDVVLGFWISELQEDSKNSRKLLREMAEPESIESLVLLNKPISPVAFVDPRFSEVFVNKIKMQLNQVDDQGFFELVNKFIDESMIVHLAFLSSRINTLNNRYLTQIEKRVVKNKSIPLPFLQAMSERRHLIGAPFSVFDVFKKEK
jgi:hypothetical protein